MRASLRSSTGRKLMAAVVLLALVLGASAAILLSSGPTLVTRLLAGALDRRVELESVELFFGRAFEVELRGLRVYESGSGEADPALFEAARARGRQSWPRVLAGHFVPLEWAVDGPILRVAASRTGSQATPRPSTPDMPLHKLTVQEGTIEAALPDGHVATLRGLAGTLRRSALTGRLGGELTAGLELDGTPRGSVTLGLAGPLHEPQLRLQLEDIELAALPAREGLEIERGRARGRVSLHLAEDGLDAELDVTLTELSLRLAASPRALAPRDVRIELGASWRDGALELRPKGTRIDDLVWSGQLRLTPGPQRRVQGTLRLAPFELGRPGGRLQLVRLMGLRFHTWELIDRRLEAGVIEDFEMSLDLSVDELVETLTFVRRPSPEELRIQLHLRHGRYRREPDSIPLEPISGLLRVVGNRLEIDGLEISREGHPFPQVNLSIEGVHRLVRLPREERRVPRGPGVPIPGLRPAFRALQARTAGGPPRPVRLRNFRVGHPAFVLPIRDLDGWLSSAPGGGLALDRAEGVLGGAPARLSGVWDAARHRIDGQVEYHDEEAPPPEEKSEAGWAAGTIETEQLYLGHWRMEEVRARLRARGARIELTDVNGRFAEGRLSASGRLSLAEEGYAPYAFDFAVEDADAAQLSVYTDLGVERVTGTAFVEGNIEAVLEPGEPLLASADVAVHMRCRDGAVRDLPFSIALARLPSVQGLGGLFGRPLPYDSLYTDLAIVDGMLRVRELLLEGPELRMTAAGEIDLVSPRHEQKMIVALLFLQTVDRVIGQLPVLKELILGKDGSLVTLYFSVEGPRDDLRAQLLAPDAVTRAGDWTAKMISGGVSRLKSLLGFPPAEGNGHDPSGPSEDP